MLARYVDDDESSNGFSMATTLKWLGFRVFCLYTEIVLASAFFMLSIGSPKKYRVPIIIFQIYITKLSSKFKRK
jgi:hypothetical protein